MSVLTNQDPILEDVRGRGQDILEKKRFGEK